MVVHDLRVFQRRSGPSGGRSTGCPWARAQKRTGAAASAQKCCPGENAPYGWARRKSPDVVQRQLRTGHDRASPGVHALGNGKGGHVHAFQLQNGTELTPVDTLFDDDGGLVLQAIERLGRQPRDLKRIVITHGHRSHLGWVAALHRAMGATVHARSWEADIVSGDRPAQPVTILTKQSLKLRPFQLGLWLNRPRHVPSPVSGTLAGGDSFGPLQGAVRARHSPGHLVF